MSKLNLTRLYEGLRARDNVVNDGVTNTGVTDIAELLGTLVSSNAQWRFSNGRMQFSEDNGVTWKEVPFRRMINVADYVLEAGGTLSDTSDATLIANNNTGIAAAIAAAAPAQYSAGGPCLFFPTGVYCVSGTITITGTTGWGLMVLGERGSLDFGSAGGTNITWKGAAGGTVMEIKATSGARIIGLSVNCNSLAKYGIWHHFNLATNPYRGSTSTYFENLTVHSWVGVGSAAFRVGTAEDVELAYNTQTANFSGTTVTGATSGASGTLVRDIDSGTTGTLTLSPYSGTFQVGEIITGSTTGSATVETVTGPNTRQTDVTYWTNCYMNGTATTVVATASDYGIYTEASGNVKGWVVIGGGCNGCNEGYYFSPGSGTFTSIGVKGGNHGYTRPGAAYNLGGCFSTIIGTDQEDDSTLANLRPGCRFITTGGNGTLTTIIGSQSHVYGCPPYLLYDGQTTNFTAGTTVTGQTSGHTATIQHVIDDGSTGTLRLSGATGVFQDNENLQVSAVTYAQANGTLVEDDYGIVVAGQLDLRSNSFRNLRTASTRFKIKNSLNNGPINDTDTTQGSSIIESNQFYQQGSDYLAKVLPLYDGNGNLLGGANYSRESRQTVRCFGNLGSNGTLNIPMRNVNGLPFISDWGAINYTDSSIPTGVTHLRSGELIRTISQMQVSYAAFNVAATVSTVTIGYVINHPHRICAAYIKINTAFAGLATCTVELGGSDFAGADDLDGYIIASNANVATQYGLSATDLGAFFTVATNYVQGAFIPSFTIGGASRSIKITARGLTNLSGLTNGSLVIYLITECIK